MIDTPAVGTCYQIRLQNVEPKVGETLTLEFLSASTFFNGIEALDDLENIYICRGRVEALGERHKPKGIGEAEQTITFSVQSVANFRHHTQPPSAPMTEQSWGEEFFKEYTNILRIDDYVLAVWMIDSYIGRECLMWPRGKTFDILYTHEWSFGNPSSVGVGCVQAPQPLVEQLRHRLALMGGAAHWSGRKGE